jgi:hypothetical protein
MKYDATEETLRKESERSPSGESRDDFWWLTLHVSIKLLLPILINFTDFRFFYRHFLIVGHC